MSWELNTQEYNSILRLPVAKRYSYFVKRVADWGEVWSLANQDGWVLASDDAMNEVIPIWPHSKFAEACANGEWENTTPQAIKVSLWIERWTPGMIGDKKKVAVFPIPNDKGIVVEPEKLRNDIQEELTKIE